VAHLLSTGDGRPDRPPAVPAGSDDSGADAAQNDGTLGASRDNAGAVHPSLALELTTTVLIVISIASVVLLVLIIVAPWKTVRQEGPIDPDVEAKLLLHRDPDEPTGEMPVTRLTDPKPPQDD
jgi:hypothetical protein